MLDPETDPMVRLAGAVADGEQIDWNRERELATGELSVLIHGTAHLRRIFKLAAQEPADAPGETSPL